VWMGLWVVVLQVSLGLQGMIDSVALLSPANLFFYNLQLSPSLGLGLAAPLLWGLVAWFLGLGALMTVLGVAAALLSDRRRAVRRGAPLVTWVVLAATLAAGGWFLHARAVRAHAIALSPASIQAGAWQVEEHLME